MPDHRADLGDPRLLERPGDPEVGQFDRHLAAADRAAEDHQVARLDVAVDDPAAVRVVEPGAGLRPRLGRGLGADRPLPLQDLGPGAALDVLHDDEVAAVVDAGVVDLDDVGVDQFGDRQRLAPEAFDEALVVGEVLGEHLDRDRPLEDQVFGLVDVRHAARAEPVAELVAAREGPARHQPPASLPGPDPAGGGFGSRFRRCFGGLWLRLSAAFLRICPALRLLPVLLPAVRPLRAFPCRASAFRAWSGRASFRSSAAGFLRCLPRSSLRCR